MATKFPKSEKYNFSRNLVKRHKLVTHLDRYLGTEIEDFHFHYEPKVPDDAWHPSGHCTPSVTELYDIATGNIEKKDWGTSMLKTFMVGHFWHQLLQKAVVDLGFADESAIEVKGVRYWGDLDVPDHTQNHTEGTTRFFHKPYHWATGAGDVAPCSIPGHGDYVIDFKTMSSHQYKSSGIPEWAADKYEAQINIYMDFFDLERGIIVPICKDTPHEFKEFEFVRNQPLIDMIYNKWEFVSECLDMNEPPDELDNDCFDITPLLTGPVAQ